MKITLLRHGQSTYNIRHRLNGDPGVAVVLTEKGKEQARRAGALLASEDFSHYFVSEFPRAQATLELVRPKQAYVVDARLNDIRTGFEGKSVIAWATRLKLQRNPIKAHFNDGESIADVHDRTRSFIQDKIVRLPDDACVLIVSHILPIQTLICILDGVPIKEATRIRVRNASPIVKHLKSDTIQAI